MPIRRTKGNLTAEKIGDIMKGEGGRISFSYLVKRIDLVNDKFVGYLNQVTDQTIDASQASYIELDASAAAVGDAPAARSTWNISKIGGAAPTYNYRFYPTLTREWKLPPTAISVVLEVTSPGNFSIWRMPITQEEAGRVEFNIDDPPEGIVIRVNNTSKLVILPLDYGPIFNYKGSETTIVKLIEWRVLPTGGAPL